MSCSVHRGKYKVLYSREPVTRSAPLDVPEPGIPRKIVAQTAEPPPPPSPPPPPPDAGAPIAGAASAPPAPVKPAGTRTPAWATAGPTSAPAAPPAAAPAAEPARPEGTKLRLRPMEYRPQPKASVERDAGQSVMLEGRVCAYHPEMPVRQRCSMCQAGICVTCDFEFPINIHVCPKCVEAAMNKVSADRKRAAVGALVLATWSTIGMVVIFTGLLARLVQNELYLALADLFLFLVPCLVGTGIGVGAIERRLRNPPYVWVAAVWNLILFGVLFFQMVINNLMG
ncbi:MAG: hypothetical protein JXR37_21650 [Kiritimatiellae bacterium]|nr:hypothetical protein [Kiritimatiellia bacterium]